MQQLFTTSPVRKLCVAIMMMIAAHAGAQNTTHTDDEDFKLSRHIRGGIILGMNAAQIDGDDYSGFHKVGFNGGFYGELPISNIFFFSTEILFTQKGAKSETIQGQPRVFSWTLDYAEVPIIFHFQNKKAFNIGGGFSYSRMVYEQLYYKQEPQPPVQFCTVKPDAALIDLNYLCLKRSDFTIMADANYLPTKHLAINVRYAYSLFPIGFNGSSNFINRQMVNNLLSFRLMWIFGS